VEYTVELLCYDVKDEGEWWTDDVISTVSGGATKSNHCAGINVNYVIVSVD
jgi:hypothetical protein